MRPTYPAASSSSVVPEVPTMSSSIITKALRFFLFKIVLCGNV